MSFHENNKKGHLVDYYEDNDLNEIEDEQTHYEKYKHIYHGGIAIILLIIAFSSFLLSPFTTSKFFSNALDGNFENNVFVINSTSSIILAEGIHDELIQHYRNNQPNEMKACLEGEKSNGNFLVKNIFYPKIIDQQVMHVISYGCRENTLVDLHSHPFSNCLLSTTDMNSFENAKSVNPDMIMGVMCSEKDFIFLVE